MAADEVFDGVEFTERFVVQKLTRTLSSDTFYSLLQPGVINIIFPKSKDKDSDKRRFLRALRPLPVLPRFGLRRSAMNIQAGCLRFKIFLATMHGRSMTKTPTVATLTIILCG